jgi:GxxExxY protein
LRLNELTFKVRGAIFEVYKILGPGLLESTYEAALGYEFDTLGLEYKTQVPINVLYKGKDLGLGYRMDMLIEDMLVLELKSVEILTEAHKKQLHTYLKLANKPLGLLINFNTINLYDNIIRIVNGNISSL